MPSSGIGPYFTRLLGVQNADGTLTGVTTGTSIALKRWEFANLSIYIQAIGNPGVGTIVIEEAAWDPKTQLQYSGTWSPIQTVDAAALVTDAQLAVHVTGSCVGYVRVRISADVTVGTVVIMAMGN